MLREGYKSYSRLNKNTLNTWLNILSTKSYQKWIKIEYKILDRDNFIVSHWGKANPYIIEIKIFHLEL